MINKRICKRIAMSLIVTLSLIAVFYLYAFLMALNGTNVIIDPSVKYQTIKGFGASAAWYYQDLGKNASEEIQSKALRMLYSPDEGMQLSIFRYNIGGGSIEISDKVQYKDPFKLTESFFISERYKNMESFSDVSNYDFSRDAEVVALLEKALALGNIKKLVFFANSPHYLMTKSGLTHGANINDNNLPPENYIAYSDYLILISHHLYEKVAGQASGIELAISPINEPQWKWGGEDATQEGCHYDPHDFAEFYEVFYERLSQFNKDNNTNYHIDAFESGSYKLKQIKEYLAASATKNWFKEQDTISVHSYHAQQSIRHKKAFTQYLNKYYPNKKIAMTEFCQMEWGRDTSLASGLLAADVAIKDLAYLNATEWGWWLSIASEDYNSGLVYYDDDDGGKLSVLKRYYTLSHFTKFITPGSERIKASINDIANITGIQAVAFLTPQNETVVVLLNKGAINYKVKLDNAYLGAKVYVTNETDNLKESVLDKETLSVMKGSITTIVIAN